MATINDVEEGARGCGYRKPGGYYLRSDDANAYQCRKLPIELSVCPHCGEGIKQSRSYRWISGNLILNAPCTVAGTEHCEQCPFDLIDPEERVMLIWIGERFYPTVAGFLEEARIMGISRRLTAFPRDFEIGKTKVALAHVAAIHPVNEEPRPGIFYIFTPDRMEYTVSNEESEDQLDRIAEKGVDLVRVHRKPVQSLLNG